jgi:hypothetical protein
MKTISSYTDVKDLRQIMINAKRAKRDDVYWEAFRRVCELEGMNYDDPLERDFYATLTADEELLSEKNGKRTRANRTRTKLQNKGVVGCLEDWAMSTQPTEGFNTLVANGQTELTGEFLVTKYADRFSPEAVTRAKARLAELTPSEVHTNARIQTSN